MRLFSFSNDVLIELACIEFAFEGRTNAIGKSLIAQAVLERTRIAKLAVKFVIAPCVLSRVDFAYVV